MWWVYLILFGGLALDEIGVGAEEVSDNGPKYSYVGNGYWWTPAFRWLGQLFSKGYYYKASDGRMYLYKPPTPKPTLAPTTPVLTKVNDVGAGTPAFDEKCFRFIVNARDAPCGKVVETVISGKKVSLRIAPGIQVQVSSLPPKKVCCPSSSGIKGCYDWSQVQYRGKSVWAGTYSHNSPLKSFLQKCKPPTDACWPNHNVNLRNSPCGVKVSTNPLEAGSKVRIYAENIRATRCTRAAHGFDGLWSWAPILKNGVVVWAAAAQLNDDGTVKEQYMSQKCKGMTDVEDDAPEDQDTDVKGCDATCRTIVGHLRKIFAQKYNSQQYVGMYHMLRNSLNGLGNTRKLKAENPTVLANPNLLTLLVASVDVGTTGKFVPVSLPPDKAVGTVRVMWDKAGCDGEKLKQRGRTCDLLRIRGERGYIPFLSFLPKDGQDPKFPPEAYKFGCKLAPDKNCANVIDPVYTARNPLSYCACTMPAVPGGPVATCDENPLVTDADKLSTYTKDCMYAGMLSPVNSGKAIAYAFVRHAQFGQRISMPLLNVINGRFDEVFDDSLLPRSTTANKFRNDVAVKAGELNPLVRAKTKEVQTLLFTLTGVKPPIRADGRQAIEVCIAKAAQITRTPCGESATSFGNERMSQIRTGTTVYVVEAYSVTLTTCQKRDPFTDRVIGPSRWLAVVPLSSIDDDVVFVPVLAGTLQGGRCRSNDQYFEETDNTNSEQDSNDTLVFSEADDEDNDYEQSSNLIKTNIENSAWPVFEQESAQQSRAQMLDDT